MGTTILRSAISLIHAPSDLDSDVLIIDAKTPWGMASGGGFGNTLEMDGGTLVTAYTYRGADDRTHLGVARWRIG